MPASMTPAPGALPSAPGEAELDDAEGGMEDKLYCICETKYDDESVMIACDRCVTANSSVVFHLYHDLHSCDEWYHTSCVNMPDLEVDLVDQFICPLCVESAYA
jgi:COMPASS component SPP1